MKLGIIGKPQSGKTTVFNAAAQQQQTLGGYGRATHQAVVKVPDPRVDELARLVHPKKLTYAEIDFIDAPGFSGQGKASEAVEISPELKMVDALMIVVDHFTRTDRARQDIQDILDEMSLADQVIIDSNIAKKERKGQLTGDKAVLAEIELLRQCLTALESGRLLIDLDLHEAQLKQLRGYTFLTQKPILFVLNIGEDDVVRADEIAGTFADLAVPGKRDITAVCGKIEMELVSLEEAERKPFMSDLGIAQPAVEKVIQKSYALLGLISFLTAGEPEVRAWTIPRGTVAQRAAGVIHSDIERGFIRAEVTAYSDYMEHKTPAALKAAGKTRLEGKEYVVQDGDVVLFRFNV